MLVRRTALAESDALDIALTLSENSLKVAMRFLDNIEAAVGQLSRFPFSGPHVTLERFPTLRCIAVPQFPKHILFYVVEELAVTVVRIGSTRRDWSDLLGDSDELAS